jgi:hypothetical protein
MAKARTGKARSGGGLTSNKLVRPSVKAGPPRSNKVSIAATDALGQQLAYKRPNLIKGTMPQVPMGNAVAAQTVCGPGGSRTVSNPVINKRMALSLKAKAMATQARRIEAREQSLDRRPPRRLCEE